MKKIVQRLGWFIKEEKRSYIAGVGALGLIAFLNLFPPRLIGNIMDKIVENGLTRETLILYVVLLLAIAGVVYLLRYAWRIYIFGAAFRLEKKMRLSLFEHFTKMSPSFYQNYRIGDLMAHSTSDIKAIQRVAGGGVLQFADALLTGSFVLIAMVFTISWKLTLVVLLPMPVMIIGAQKLSSKLHKAFMSSQESFSDMNNRVHESISGMKVTKTFGQEELEIKRFKKESEVLYDKYMNVSKYDILFTPLIMFVIVSCYILIFAVGIRLIQNGEITTGMLGTFITYMHTLIWPMMAIGFLFNTIERGNASFDRIEKLMNEPEDIISQKGAYEHTPEGNLVFNIDSFNYPDGTKARALENMHFELKEGQTLGIVGKTGSGKSTMIKLLLREYDEYDGEILLDDISIQNYSLQALRNATGYVPQDNFLFSMSILDNIRFGRPDATLEEVMEVAKIANVHDDIMGFEYQYETLIGERGVSLSGGQKQRVSIARALLLNPQILILDDSLSAVDAKTEEIILSGLKETRNNKTTLIAAHRISALKHAELILVLDNGKILESGNHEELLAKEGWYATIYEQQEFTKEKQNDEQK